jgi:RNA polymerase sigma-70 factor (ECF subfamily)
MTWRLALDHRRADKRRLNREEAVALPPLGDAEADAVARDRSARLWNAIDRLPEKLRVVTVLAAIEGHGVKEVAALTGAPEGTVKSRLFDARKLLQEMLQ